MGNWIGLPMVCGTTPDLQRNHRKIIVLLSHIPEWVLASVIFNVSSVLHCFLLPGMCGEQI